MVACAHYCNMACTTNVTQAEMLTNDTVIHISFMLRLGYD